VSDGIAGKYLVYACPGFKTIEAPPAGTTFPSTVVIFDDVVVEAGVI